MELRTFLLLLWRRKWIFLISYLLFFGSVIAWAYLATPIWDGTAKVMLVESSTALSTFKGYLGIATQDTALSAATTAKNYDTEIALATIGQSLDKLISDLKLTSRKGKPLTRKKLVPSSPLWKVAYKLVPQPYLEVSHLESSDILEITSYSTSAVQSARMSNELANLFVKNHVTTVRGEFQAVRMFLKQQIKTLEQQYKTLALAKRDMQIADNSVDLEVESRNLLDYIVTLEKKILELESEIAGKTVDITEAHPDIQALRKKVEITRELINKKLQTDRSGFPEKKMKQSEIDMILSVYSNLYIKMLDYLMKLDMAESLTLSKITVVEPAVVQDDAVFPSKPLSFVLSTIFGFCFALGVVLVIESLGNPEKKPAETKEVSDSVPGKNPGS